MAGTPQLIMDINPNPVADSNSFADVGGIVFFPVYTEGTGSELWKSDGTAAGTVRVKGINSKYDGVISGMTNMAGTLYFSASTSVEGADDELWKSDGTEEGTVRVKEINPGKNDSVRNLTSVNGTLYFSADDGTNGSELWKSDGTEAGTVRVKDINPRKPNGMLERGSYPSFLTNVNGTLYFSATDLRFGENVELWKSDGTEAGTVRVKDINPGNGSADPRYLNNVDGTLYFSAMGAGGRELWKSDGTEAGTVRVKDINPGGGGSNPSPLLNVNGTLYFGAYDVSSGRELWKSDGTEAGTVRIKDINPGVGNSLPGHLTSLNGSFYFRATDGSSGHELWKSDGTEIGTVLVKDIVPGDGSGLDPYSDPLLTNVNGTLYFVANDEAGGSELWTSDGTEAATHLVADLRPGSAGSQPGSLTQVAKKLYFAATDDVQVRQLWVLDADNSGDDRNQDGVIDTQDLDAICTALAAGTATQDDLEGFWTRQNTGPGDSNFDHLFDSSDLIAAFTIGKYESQSPASWNEGDWNCDGLFDSGDLVTAFQRGWYEAGPMNTGEVDSEP